MAKPSKLLSTYFPFEPTPSQSALFESLNDFILNKVKRRQTFVLKGYAGTGKTSITSTLVKILKHFEYKAMLLAPTGRAAKVMSFYSQRKAFTIHKIIFKLVEDPKTGQFKFVRQRNKQENTIYIVDEASMIDDTGRGGYGLLTDLVNFVFENPFSGNKLLLVGDTAQLPPVHQILSPALDEARLGQEFSLEVQSAMLTEVVRQAEKSGILENATLIRDHIHNQQFALNIQTKAFKDIFKMSKRKLEDGLHYAYNKFGMENTTIICRSNRAATQYNKFIRQQIHFAEAEIEAGDYLMIVKNNYHWLPIDSIAGFLANGEFVEVMKVLDIEENFGMRFADLSLRLVDYPDHKLFQAKVHLNTLHSYTPSLEKEELDKLYEQVRYEYVGVEEDAERMALIKNDPYANALQVKYAYALTCHKSQGGQWDAVFVDMGYVKEEMMDIEFLRWVYTAMTRASKELFLVDFLSKFFV